MSYTLSQSSWHARTEKKKGFLLIGFIILLLPLYKDVLRMLLVSQIIETYCLREKQKSERKKKEINVLVAIYHEA